MVGRTLPYSTYHVHDADQREKMIYKLRKTSLEALADLKTWKTDSNFNKELFNKPGSKNICIGIWARSSGHDRLLSQTLGALLSRTPLTYEDRIRITVFSSKDFAELQDVKNVVIVQLLNQNNITTEEGEYSEILKALYRQNCAFGVVLKQGVIASREWIRKVEEIIGTDIYKDPDPEWILLRLFGDYSDLSYTWREPGVLLLIISISCLLCMAFWCVTWLALKLVKKDRKFLFEIHPLIPMSMIICCFVGLLLLGRPNMPPIWHSPIIPVDSLTYPFATLYPRKRLIDLAVELDRGTNVASSHEGNSISRSFEQLRRRLVKERAQKYTISAIRPSLFQNIDVSSTSNIMDIPISFDFPDGNVPVTFGAPDFLAVNKRKYFPYE